VNKAVPYRSFSMAGSGSVTRLLARVTDRKARPNRNPSRIDSLSSALLIL
jgi:hypothetical protein